MVSIKRYKCLVPPGTNDLYANNMVFSIKNTALSVPQNFTLTILSCIEVDNITAFTRNSRYQINYLLGKCCSLTLRNVFTLFRT